jgi:hypothetical protein
MADARDRFVDALKIIALKIGGAVTVESQGGHFVFQISQEPDDPSSAAALDALVDAVEIATSHMCPLAVSMPKFVISVMMKRAVQSATAFLAENAGRQTGRKR